MTETGNSDLNLTITDVKLTPPPPERVTFDIRGVYGWSSDGPRVAMDTLAMERLHALLEEHPDATVTLTIEWTPAAESPVPSEGWAGSQRVSSDGASDPKGGAAPSDADA